MLKFRKGNTRIAFVLFNWLVIKLPNPRFDWLRRRLETRGIAPLLKEIPSLLYEALLYGVTANVSEALVYSFTLGARFLSPVLTIGIASFQLYEGEDEPTDAEMKALYQGLPEDALQILPQTSLHDSARWNWRKTPKGLRLIDYGVNPFTAPWAIFLRGSVKELNAKTARG